MKQISFWAFRHYWVARVLITVIKLLLISAAIFLGLQIRASGIILSPMWFYLSLTAFLLVTIYYPGVSQKRFRHGNAFYIHRKSFDFTAVILSFLMVMYISAYQQNPITENTLHASFAGKKIKKQPTAEEVLASLEYRDKSSLTRVEKRVLKKEFRKQLGVYLISKATGKKDDAEKAALIILVIIAAIGLGALLAALACNISCSGNDGLAILVGVLGLAGIILLSVYLINQINKKGKPKKAT